MSQNQPNKRNCGAMTEHRRLLDEDPSYVAARSRIETLARAYEMGLRTSARVGITRIPVVVHVVWNSTHRTSQMPKFRARSTSSTRTTG